MGDIHEVTMRIGGEEYTLASDDDYLLAQGVVFEPETVRLFEATAANTRTSLDVGANVGCTALLLSGLSKHVHAFEPSLSTHHWLAHNVACRPNVTTHAVGLGRKYAASEITFSLQNRSGGYVSETTQASAGHVTETIHVHRLDDIVRSRRIQDIDFIKLDVEGYELHVLGGAPETLWRFRPVVVMEMNHWCLNVLHRTSLPDFIDYLCAAFPHVHAVERGHRLSLHDPSERYAVMYRHVNLGQFNALVCSYDDAKIERFLGEYRRGEPVT